MTFFTNSYNRKTIAHTLLLAMFLNFLAPLLSSLYEVKAGDGPAAPEAAQFEPIDTTDLVNLFTGNFNYNVPLLEIPGPEGGWPISMSYHAGVGPNTEATWVGLGWSLNPGAINRFVNSYPDDYYNGSIQSHYWAQKQKGYGIGIGIGYGPIGMNLNYDSYTGQTGVNASLSLIRGIAALTNGIGSAAYESAGAIGSLGDVGIIGDINLQFGTSGVGLSASIGLSSVGESGIGGSIGVSAGVHSKQKPDFGGSAGLFYSNSAKDKKGNRTGGSMSLLGTSFSSNSEGASFSVGGVGFNSQSSTNGQGQTNMSSMSIPIPIGLLGGNPLLSISLSYYEWEWWLDEFHHERAYGSLHQLGYIQDSEYKSIYKVEDIWGNETNNIIENFAKYNDDSSDSQYAIDNHDFDVNLSVSGSYSAGSSDVQHFYSRKMERKIVNDNLFSSEDLYSVSAQGISGNFKPYFKYDYKLRDFSGQGSNKTGYYYPNATLGKINNSMAISFRFEGDQGGNFETDSDIGNQFEAINNNVSSKRIRPAIDLTSGLIKGFEVQASDGRIYEFFRPVMSFYQYSINYKDRASSQSNFADNEMISPYATSWLLTGIKGTDYIDRTNNGYSSDDWGYWVHFRYKKDRKLASWKTPFVGFAKDPNDNKNETKAFGVKEKFYLHSVETASHIALFNKSSRLDNQPPNISSFSIGASKWEKVGTGVEIEFDIEKDYLDKLDITQIKLDITKRVYWLSELAGKPYYAQFNKPISYNINESSFSDFNGKLKLFVPGVEHEIVDDTGNNDYLGELVQSAKLTISLNDIDKIDLTVVSFVDNIATPRGDDHVITLRANKGLIELRSLGLHKIALNINTQADFPDFGASGTTKSIPFDISLSELSDHFTITDGSTYTDFTFTLTGSFTAVNYANGTSEDNGSIFGNLSKKLDNISVYKKVVNSLDQKTVYDHSSYINDNAIEQIQFDYDFSLQTGAINSVATNQGKLTLKSIQKLGLSSTAFIPKTEFSYYGAEGEADHINWDKDSWSIWNAYAKKNNIISQKYEEAVTEVQAFNLKEIKASVGATTRVEYEPDIVSYVKNLKIDDDYSKIPPILPPNLRVYSPSFESLLGVNIKDNIKFNNHSTQNFFDLTTEEMLELKRNTDVGGRVTIIELKSVRSKILETWLPPSYSTNKYDLTVTSFNGNRVYFDSSVDFKKFDFFEIEIVQRNEYTFEYAFVKNIKYSGGHRVKSISVISGDEQRKTDYTYNSGALSSFPSQFKKNFDNNTWSFNESMNKRIRDFLLHNGGFNQIGASPAIGYSEVVVEDIDVKTSENLNGRTIHKFHTARDYTIESNDVNNKLILTDKTGIIGKMKEVEVQGRNPVTNEFYTVKRDSMLYSFSSELASVSKKAFQKGYSSDKEVDLNMSPLGLTQQTWKSQNESVNTAEREIEYIQENVFTTGTKSVISFYDKDLNFVNSTENRTENLAFDAITGNVLVSKVLNSNKDQIITTNTPAYWKYPELETKNMLTQTSGNQVYQIDSTSNYFDLSFNNYIDDSLISASVTTWKKWTEAYDNGTNSIVDPTDITVGIWRQNDTFIAINTGPDYVPFVNWGIDDDSSGDPSPNDLILGWKRTSNITAYDRFSHPIEERGLDGNYTSSIYGHGDALPTAIAKHAKRSQILHYNFEQENRDIINVYTNNKIDWAKQHTQAKTGEYSANPTQVVLLKTPTDESVSYSVSYWYYKDANWHYYEYESAHDTYIIMPSGVTGITKIDDIKIHPINATMSTFTYDPLTWKVTSITDANGNSTYYEYDEAGRLIKVLDQERYLKAAYEYKYARKVSVGR
jgi:YD repeat-containing protein